MSSSKIQNSIIMLSILLNFFSSCSRKHFNDDLINKLQPRIFKSNKYSHPIPYRLFIPEEYNSLKKYPLVLFLHGGGERGDDNKSQIGIGVKTFSDNSIQKTHPCFILAPQCPKNSQWLNTTFKRPPFDNYSQDNIPESDAMKMIIDIINSLKKEFSIDSDRMYVTGLSMGGSGTWDIITRYPEMFAAAVPITGVSDPSRAGLVSHLPIWAFHGAKDTITPIQVTRNMIISLKKCGSKCRLTEYNEIGHNSWNAAYNNTEMLKWLFAQKKK